MLANVMITKWEGLGKDIRVFDTTNGTNYLLNGNRINGLQVRATTKSKFMFTDRRNDPREKASYVEATETNATIKADIDKTWQSYLAPFILYTNNDTTAGVYTMSINVEDISYVYSDPTSASRSYIVYQEGGKLREVLCQYTIKQVWAMVDTNSLTTTAG